MTGIFTKQTYSDLTAVEEALKAEELKNDDKGLSELRIPIHVELYGKIQKEDDGGKSDILGDNHITSFPYLSQNM